MVLLAVGVIVGVTLGVLIVGLAAVSAYNRGYDDALLRRKSWRAELVARQAVLARPAQSLRKAS